MTVKDIISRLEHVYGQQPEKYMYALINDALMDIGTKVRHYTEVATTDITKDQRWYDLDDRVIDVYRVEVLDSEDKYMTIPRLTNNEIAKGSEV